MKFGRVLSGMMVGLMLWTMLFGCATKAPVFDNQGKVITEEEINANKTKKRSRVVWGCLGVGCLGSLALVNLSSPNTEPIPIEEQDEVLVGSLIMGGCLGWWFGNSLNSRERKRAIKLIKRQRAIKRMEEKRREHDIPLSEEESRQLFYMQLFQVKLSHY